MDSAARDKQAIIQPHAEVIDEAATVSIDFLQDFVGSVVSVQETNLSIEATCES